MKLGKHGFKIVESRFVKEINATVNIYNHEQSGARLMHIDTDDDNKVFCVGFRTPPTDNTGVAHIMEHSVLCGSKKFPIKEPFVELLKGSLNTFLNAMTASDFTFYPVASRNNKDFKNLVDVYLDAVFFPNIHKYPEIMMQEGWHYELENEQDPLTISGVVYNEMKGAYSSPTRMLNRQLNLALFPDSVYRFESGGDPDYIPDLTQQQFVDFHQKFYHPSNSYFYLYGKLDINEYLNFINSEALNQFKATDANTSLEKQTPFKDPVVKEFFYPISTDEDDIHKNWYALSFVMDFKDQYFLNFAFEAIAHLLTESSSPLKQALLKSGIGKDVIGYFDNNGLQPNFTLIIKDALKGKAEEFKAIVMNTLNDMCKKGIDKDLIEAAINIKEFLLREADYSGNPKGIIHIFSSLPFWIHDQDPIEALTFEEMLETTKQALTSPFFESLINYYIIDNPYHCLLTMKPKKGMMEELLENQRKDLENIKNSLSQKQIFEIIKDTEKLKQRQMTIDSPEALATIPQLALSDINKKAEIIPTEVEHIESTTFLHHSIFTNGIAYINLYFDNLIVDQQDVPYLDILVNSLGDMSTKNYTYSELNNAIQIHTGGISTDNKIFNDKSNFDIFESKLTVSAKTLNKKLPKLIELIEEVICHTNFEDDERLFEIVNQMKSKTEISIMQRSSGYVFNRMTAYYSSTGVYKEQLNGIDQYLFLRDLVKNYQSLKPVLIQKLKNLSSYIFNKNRLVVSFTSPIEDYKIFKKEINPLIEKLNSQLFPQNSYNYSTIKDNEAFLTPGKVQYVGKGFSYRKLGFDYSGCLHVLNTFLSLDFLWNNVRVLGGAYGCNLDIRSSGPLQIVSYRDPNLRETLENYDKIGEYLKNINLADHEITKYIIGTISRFDMPMTPSQKSIHGDFYFLTNHNEKSIQLNRDQIIATTNEQLKSYADLFTKVMNENRYCVIGNESKIKENLDLFQTVIAIFE